MLVTTFAGMARGGPILWSSLILQDGGPRERLGATHKAWPGHAVEDEHNFLPLRTTNVGGILT